MMATPISKEARGGVKDMELERLLAGEIAGEEAAALRRLIDQTPELAARWQELQASNEEIFATYPAQVQIDQILVRARQADNNAVASGAGRSLRSGRTFWGGLTVAA